MLNVSSQTVEVDENSVSMTDTAGGRMQRSLNQATGTYSSLGPGRSWFYFPLFWKNGSRAAGVLRFRTGDGVKYEVACRTGMTPRGPFSGLPRAFRETVKKCYTEGRLLDSGGRR